MVVARCKLQVAAVIGQWTKTRRIGRNGVCSSAAPNRRSQSIRRLNGANHSPYESFGGASSSLQLAGFPVKTLLLQDCELRTSREKHAPFSAAHTVGRYPEHSRFRSVAAHNGHLSLRWRGHVWLGYTVFLLKNALPPLVTTAVSSALRATYGTPWSCVRSSVDSPRPRKTRIRHPALA